MNKLNVEKNYSKLSLIYDYVMRKINYNTWAKYIYSLVKSSLEPGAKALELAAGNCNLANNFVKFFPDLIVSDLSKYMLKCNTEKKFPKVCCNMTKLPFKNKFDLIYSAFDSINYLTSRKKLLEMFKQTSSILTDNGIFTFDASLERNSMIHIKQPIRDGFYKGIYFKQVSEYNKKTRIHKNIFSIFENSKTYTEIHRQKIFPFETYFDIMDLAGLYVQACFKAFTNNPGSPDSDRVQFIVRRKKHADI